MLPRQRPQIPANTADTGKGEQRKPANRSRIPNTDPPPQDNGDNQPDNEHKRFRHMWQHKPRHITPKDFIHRNPVGHYSEK